MGIAAFGTAIAATLPFALAGGAIAGLAAASVTGLRRFRPAAGLRIMTTVGVVLLTAAAVVAGADEPAGETWRGLVVAAEDRCSEYVRGDYGAAAG